MQLIWRLQYSKGRKVDLVSALEFMLGLATLLQHESIADLSCVKGRGRAPGKMLQGSEQGAMEAGSEENCGNRLAC